MNPLSLPPITIVPPSASVTCFGYVFFGFVSYVLIHMASSILWRLNLLMAQNRCALDLQQCFCCSDLVRINYKIVSNTYIILPVVFIVRTTPSFPRSMCLKSQLVVTVDCCGEFLHFSVKHPEDQDISPLEVHGPWNSGWQFHTEDGTQGTLGVY